MFQTRPLEGSTSPGRSLLFTIVIIWDFEHVNTLNGSVKLKFSKFILKWNNATFTKLPVTDLLLGRYHVVCRRSVFWDCRRTLLMCTYFTLAFLKYTHTHTHTRLVVLFPGLHGWAGTRKIKPIWILLKQETVSGSVISWAICKSATHSRQTTMPATHHLVFYRPDALPAAQSTASKHWRQNTMQYSKVICNVHMVSWRAESEAQLF